MKVYLVIDGLKPFGDWHIQQGYADKNRAINYMAILARVHNEDQDDGRCQFKQVDPEKWENGTQYLAILEIFIVE